MAKKKATPVSQTLPGIGTVPKMLEGYYSGDKPNPNLQKFVEEHVRPYDLDTDDYDVPAFNKSITTTKATAIYNMHSYHQGKKPHDAIRQYICHYTKSGDTVLDPFCGSGGTALAAQIEGRQAIAIDRSPAATFITKNYCTPVDPQDLARAFDILKRQVQPELDWLYETRCDRCSGKATTAYTIYSQVFQCPRCLQKVSLFDCVEAAGRTTAGEAKKVRVCPFCHQNDHYEEISTRTDRFGAVPVLVSYACQNGCSPIRAERRHNDSNFRKRQFFETYDLGKIKEIEAKTIPYWYPPHKMMNVEDDSMPWGVKWRAGTSSFRTVAELFTKRNLWALAAHYMVAKKAENPIWADAFRFGLNSILLAMSKMQGYIEDPRFPNQLMRGTYYLPQISREYNVSHWLDGKLNNLVAGYQKILSEDAKYALMISTQSATKMEQIPSNSIDYVFTDPSYGDNVQYGELNFVWEAWLDFDTHWHDEEIIVNEVRGKTEADWAAMMKQAMAECYRVLKPGRWLSLCYHDTSEGTWGLIQDIMAEEGFVVDKATSAIFIDTGQKSFNQLTADKTTKRDLVMNFRKPKLSEWIVTQMYNLDTFRDVAIQVIRDFLTSHPGSTKDRVYDEVVSQLVRTRQMEAHDFNALLSSVAEEVREIVKKNLFEDMEADLFSSHVISRWYLKETADQIDPSEQEKEDAAAARLEKFMISYSTKHPEVEGVHFSDLFEQVIIIPVDERPRRRFENWLPEYFFKTPLGIWRPPADQKEREQKAALREAGTLRRMKRFANALIDVVPVMEQDRPSNDRTLAEWIRQCRRAGLYEQGRALYEKGGLNLENLSEEEQIEVEDDYRICVKRGSLDVEKPKRHTKRNQE